MEKIEIDEYARREKLKVTRNLLFDSFVKNPQEVHLALEIKRIDDQIAKLCDAANSTTRLAS